MSPSLYLILYRLLVGSYIITSPSWNKLSISHLRQIIVPNGYNDVGGDRVALLLFGTVILRIFGVCVVGVLAKSIRRTSGVCTLCSYVMPSFNTLCCCILWSVGGCSIDCSASIALVRPNVCGRNGDIGGGSLSMVSKSLNDE